VATTAGELNQGTLGYQMVMGMRVMPAVIEVLVVVCVVAVVVSFARLWVVGSLLHYY
jgi:hypothetical protein